MKIDSAVNFFEDADASDAIVIFKGSGSVDGADTKVIKVIDLEGSNTTTSRLLGEDFLIKVKTEVDDFEFNLSEVENQLTWPNTRAGADAAIKAIRSWKKKSSVGFELPDPATADPGQVVGVTDGAYAFVNPPAPTNAVQYFFASFTQSTVSLTEGPLEIGVEYFIQALEQGDDFTNVGAPQIESGIRFIATGTTPTTWTNGTIVINNDLSKMQLDIQLNTTGAVPIGTYHEVGRWNLYFEGLSGARIHFFNEFKDDLHENLTGFMYSYSDDENGTSVIVQQCDLSTYGGPAEFDGTAGTPKIAFIYIPE